MKKEGQKNPHKPKRNDAHDDQGFDKRVKQKDQNQGNQQES